MKLSEDLKQCHESGDFGKALEGYAERAKLLEVDFDKARNQGKNDMCDKSLSPCGRKRTIYLLITHLICQIKKLIGHAGMNTNAQVIL